MDNKITIVGCTAPTLHLVTKDTNQLCDVITGAFTNTEI
jgi:hypothetical protein